MIVWHDGSDESTLVQARCYDQIDKPKTDVFPLHPIEGIQHQINPVIASNQNGYFVIWNELIDDKWHIIGRRFDFNGNPIGVFLKVGDNDVQSNRTLPAITAAKEEDAFLIVWQDDRNDTISVYGQWFNANGNPLDIEFEVGTGATYTKDTSPSCAAYTTKYYTISYLFSSSYAHICRYFGDGTSYTDVYFGDFPPSAYPFSLICDDVGNYINLSYYDRGFEIFYHNLISSVSSAIDTSIGRGVGFGGYWDIEGFVRGAVFDKYLLAVWQNDEEDGKFIYASLAQFYGGDFQRPSDWTHVLDQKENEVKKLVLYPNYPNPFNASTQISYYLPKSSEVTLSLYDLLGREIFIFERNQLKSPGHYQIEWDGMDAAGVTVASGIYIVRFRSDGFEKRQKIMLLK